MTIHRLPNRFLRLGLALLATALIASACSSDSNSAPSDTEPVEDSSLESPDTEVTQPARRTIKIGLAYPDLGALTVLDDSFGIGDPLEQASAMINHWNANGLLPEGIEIQLVDEKFPIADTTSKLSTCTELGNQEDILAVVGSRNFTPGAECLVTRFGIPTIDRDSASISVYRRTPYLFTLFPDQTSTLRNYAQWAVENGELEGKRVGIYYETQIITDGVDELRQTLEEAGADIVAEVSTSGEGVGSNAEDSLAVARFIDEDVDLVVSLIGGSGFAAVQGYADDQNFFPRYLSSDFGNQTNDAAAKPYPASQFDGTIAMTSTRVGDLSAGTLSPKAVECLDIYSNFSGNAMLEEGPETAEFANILLTCDLMSILLAGLQGAGPDVDRESLVQALESAGTMSFASAGDGAFSADDHSAVDQYRTVQWDATECTCWKPTTDFVGRNR